MADKDNIDKALPNVDQEIVAPEEIIVTEEQKETEVDPNDAEVIMDEEGVRKLILIPEPINR